MSKNNRQGNNNYSKKNYKNKKGNYTDYNSKDDYRKKNSKSRAGSTYNEYVGSENDPRWYTQNQRLITDVTKIPFNSQIGRPISLGYSTVDVPAIMTLDVVTCPGVSSSNSDGVNIAGQAVFQKMRKDLSTYASYAQADVTVFIMAMVNLFTEYATIARFFGVVNVYSSVNLAYSDVLLEAMGMSKVDIQDFRANLNDYRALFNNLIYKAQSLYLPAAFPIVERYLWLFSNYFYDHDDPRAQIYMYRPAHFWMLNEKGAQGSALEPVGAIFGMKEMLKGFNTAIESIRNSDSMLKIMADMRRAFQDVTPWKLSYLDENFTILPTHSTEVLSQIENTIVMPGLPDLDVNITQSVEKNTLIYTPSWTDSALAEYIINPSGSRNTPFYNALTNYFINMHWSNPTSDDIVVATRNMPTVDLSGSENLGGLKLTSCGSDYIVHAFVWVYNVEKGVSNFEVPYLLTVVPQWATLGFEPNSAFLSPKEMSQYLMFDWAPRSLMFDLKKGATGTDLVDDSSYCPLVETDNYTILRRDLMERIHNNVILSMWNVPELGTTYN